MSSTQAYLFAKAASGCFAKPWLGMGVTLDRGEGRDFVNHPEFFLGGPGT